MSTIKLIPCPFCGARDDDLKLSPLWGADDSKTYVVCVCSAEGPLGDSIPEAVSLWNARVESKP